MPEIGQLTRSKPVDVVVDLGDGDTVTLSFDRNKVTPHWIREAEKRDSEKDVLSLPKALSEVILSWDVTNEGAPFEPTADNIAVLSYPAQRDLLERIMLASVPSSEEGEGSSVTSSTQATDSLEQPASPQNGPVISELPAPSVSPSPT